MDKKIFTKFIDLIYRKSGISLNENKEALVSARIAKRMRSLGIDNHSTYLKHVLEDASGEEIVLLLDAISTNVTHFFREDQHFTFLRQEMRRWLNIGQRRFRFWSAGCSSGEEPYSMAITLLETLNGSSSDIRILATDISTRILQHSIAGEYEVKRMENVPSQFRERYFNNYGQGENIRYRVSEKLRTIILFKRLNLSVVPFPMRGPLDVIFCRNVMIYFDNYIRQNLLGEFYRLLKPGGYLMVGHAESLTGMLSGFKSVSPSVYMKE